MHLAFTPLLWALRALSYGTNCCLEGAILLQGLKCI